MTAQARFVAYVEYEPGRFHAEFEVTGHPTIPEKSQVNCDTLRALKIPVPEFPSYWHWVRERFGRRLAISKYLKEQAIGR